MNYHFIVVCVWVCVCAELNETMKRRIFVSLPFCNRGRQIDLIEYTHVIPLSLTHTHTLCKCIYDYRVRAIVSERAASHTEWLAVGLHISALNVKHMLICGWESRE